MNSRIRTLERDEVYLALSELVNDLDVRKLAGLSWVGVSLFTGLLENT